MRTLGVCGAGRCYCYCDNAHGLELNGVDDGPDDGHGDDGNVDNEILVCSSHPAGTRMDRY